MNEAYLATVRLLIAIVPDIFQNPLFAMKGGTALNLFLHNLPRLSVDIDVAFTDHSMNRKEALAHIETELSRSKEAIEKQGFKVRLSQTAAVPKTKGDDVKLTVFSDAATVKVEVNYVFRGTLLPVTRRSLVPAAAEMFSASIAAPTLDEVELYGSKLVAAMDRQHPRDMFDVKYMFDKYGLQGEIIDAFVAYIAGHNRPVHEVVFAPAKQLKQLYEADFAGMTVNPVSLDTLEAVQAKLLQELPAAMNENQRQFLLSLVRADPDWSLMPYPHLKNLPAVQWKLQNLMKLKESNPERFAQQEILLSQRFGA